MFAPVLGLGVEAQGSHLVLRLSGSGFPGRGPGGRGREWEGSPSSIT